MYKTSANSASNAVLDILRATYKTVFIPAIDAGREIGYAEKTTRNLVSEGRFPLKTEKIGAKRMVSIFVLAQYVSERSNLGQTSAVVRTPARKGARTKAERMRAQGRA